MTSSDSAASAATVRKQAIRFILLFGIISLFGDLTYEGARSVNGPFLLTLGASATTVGFVAGLGEFLGYGVRLVSGYLADRYKRYWLLANVGYAVGLLAVPLLALAGRWEVAAGLVILERFGKAIRSPGKDAMLSFATKQVGRGYGFGLQEALDQVGAIGGPLLLSGALIIRGGFRPGFALLLIPALLSLTVLALTQRRFPDPSAMEPEEIRAKPEEIGAKPEEAGAKQDEPAGEPEKQQGKERAGRRLSREFWLYMAFSAVAVLGFAHFQVISYHLKAHQVMSDPQIPVAFAIAMAVDGVTALVVGKLYDRVGLGTLLLLPVTSIPATLLAFGGSVAGAWLGIALWGVGMGIQETIVRAAVADLTRTDLRGMAYGVFNAAYGIAFFIGSTVMGAMYDRSVAAVIIFSVAAQAASLPLFAMMRRAAAPH